MKSRFPRIFLQVNFIDIALLFLAVSLSVNIVSLYISSERFFYYWDIGGYQGVAINVANHLLISIRATLVSIRESLKYDYNFYFTIPLIPLILLFGKTRLSFVMSVALIYQIPYALVIGAIATKMIPLPRRSIFWSAVFITLLTPIAWAATLQAYPDVGAALFIALATLIYIHDVKLKNWWQMPLIGIFLGTAILLRRPFSYDVIAFFSAMTLNTFFYFSKPLNLRDGQAWREVLKEWGRIGFILVITILTLLAFGKPFFIRAITTNFNFLYSSYAMDPSRMLRFFLSIYGWGTWILVALGFTFGIIRKVLRPSMASFIILFGLFSFIAWIIIVRMIAITFPLHTAIVIILGMVGLIWVILTSLQGKMRILALTGMAMFFIANLGLGLTPTQLDAELRPLFSQSNPPFKRADYSEVVRLINYLRQITLPDEPIYISDSSHRMNYDLAIKAEQQLFQDQKLNIFVTPQIDSRDYYPLEQLVQAQYVIVTDPFQSHLSRPEEQKVVQVILKAFTEDWEIARDFTRLPEQFNLVDGAVLSIYKRTGPTSLETALRTYGQMQNFIGSRPGSQPDWIVLSQFQMPSIKTSQDKTYHLSLSLGSDQNHDSLSLLSTETASEAGKVAGNLRCLENKCAKVTLGLMAVDLAGNISYQDKVEIKPDKKLIPFSLEYQTKGGEHLVLSIDRTNGKNDLTACPIELEWGLIN